MMEEHRYFTIQHRTVGASGTEFWFDANPLFYGLHESNYFHNAEDAKALMESIKALAKPEDQYRIVHHVHTEEVVA